MQIILVDANSIGYAGQAASDLKSGEQPTSAIYNTLQNLKKLKLSDPTAKIIYLWDSKAKFRYAINPNYKAKRNITPEQKKNKAEYHSQQPFIKQMLSHLGIAQCLQQGFEADDLAFYLTNYFLGKGHEVTMVSSDKDWLQMIVSSKVKWYDPRLDRTCMRNNFQSIAKAQNPKEFVQRKCILGDASDNIDGIDGLGEKACDAIFLQWQSVVHMLKAHRSLKQFTKENTDQSLHRYLKKLNAFCNNENDLIQRYKNNLMLMDLSLAPPIGKLKFDKGEKDMDAFFDLCGQLAFVSVLGRKQIWENVFFTGKDAA